MGGVLDVVWGTVQDERSNDECSGAQNPSPSSSFPQVTPKGLTVHLTPTVTGHIPAQMASEDTDVSNWH